MLFTLQTSLGLYKDVLRLSLAPLFQTSYLTHATLYRQQYDYFFVNFAVSATTPLAQAGTSETILVVDIISSTRAFNLVSPNYQDFGVTTDTNMFVNGPA